VRSVDKQTNVFMKFDVSSQSHFGRLF
jgi:hypothetical protein